MSMTVDKLMWDDAKFSQTTDAVEQITGVYAKHMVLQAGIPDYPKDTPLSVLDNACGAGVVTSALHETLQSRPSHTYSVTCGDLADAMIEAARHRVKREGWTNTEVLKVDAQDTKLPSNQFTHIFTNFGPMLFPNPDAMLSECSRMLRPGGTCAFTTWQEVGWVPDLKAAMQSMSELPPFPTAREIATAFGQGAWDDPSFIKDKVASHGFTDIEIKAVSNTSRFVNADELKAVLVPTVGIITSKFMTQEQRDKFAGPALNVKIQKWFEDKYEGGIVEWHWVALITTSRKP